jgi:hypothetical protein
LPQPFEILK